LIYLINVYYFLRHDLVNKLKNIKNTWNNSISRDYYSGNHSSNALSRPDNDEYHLIFCENI